MGGDGRKGSRAGRAHWLSRCRPPGQNLVPGKTSASGQDCADHTPPVKTEIQCIFNPSSTHCEDAS